VSVSVTAEVEISSCRFDVSSSEISARCSVGKNLVKYQ